MILAAVTALVLGGGGAAWAWWAITGSLQASAAAQAVLPPTNLQCAESGLLDIRLTWTAPVQALPTGATRRYVVVATSTSGVETEVGAVDTTTTRTIAPSALPADGTYTLSVKSRVSFPSTTWTSTPSNLEPVVRGWFLLSYLNCA